jgi:hypothetical protein
MCRSARRGKHPGPRSRAAILSIAKDTGHFWKTIWNDPGNAQLNVVRKDPGVLLAGDRVHVPPLQKKQEPGPTEMRHRFVRRGEPALFRIQILVEGNPRGGEPYTVEVGGKPHFSGVTAANGMVEFPVPGNAARGTLRVGVGDDQLILELNFGWLDPITEIKGIQERLRNMGYMCGTDGTLDETTRAAIKTFQQRNGLPATGEPDAAAAGKIQQTYGA